MSVAALAEAARELADQVIAGANRDWSVGVFEPLMAAAEAVRRELANDPARYAVSRAYRDGWRDAGGGDGDDLLGRSSAYAFSEAAKARRERGVA